VARQRRAHEPELSEDRLVKPRRQAHEQAFGRTIPLALALLLPATVAGCPEFRNQVVDAAETAAINIILAEEEPCTAFEAAGLDVIGAALDLFFDQFRSETSTY
jgi:hypothetical protein